MPPLESLFNIFIALQPPLHQGTRAEDDKPLVTQRRHDSVGLVLLPLGPAEVAIPTVRLSVSSRCRSCLAPRKKVSTFLTAAT